MNKRKFRTKLFQQFSVSIVILIMMVSCGNSDGVTDPPESVQPWSVGEHGQLSVHGTNLVDRSGNPIVLRGMSLCWSQWGGRYFNEETIKWLRDDWKCTAIRAPLGVEFGGYLEHPDQEYQKVTDAIDACIKLGLYVIVDWHDHHGEDHLEHAKTFFGKISEAYGGKPNIIYELYNEPIHVSWKNDIKPYAEALIQIIRANDPKNVIVVGTSTWSQDVDDVIGNRINDANTMYTLHFYTGTHRQELRDKAETALNAGIPIFVTEWGLSEASGTGAIDIDETNLWVNFLEKYYLSWCNWSVINKDESSAALLPSTSSLGGWSINELTQSGQIIRDYLIRMNGGSK